MTANERPPAPPLDRVRVLTQQAVGATASAYTEDAKVDVDARLRQEMADRGLPVEEGWIAEVAHRIRSGHHVSFDDPGSAGG